MKKFLVIIISLCLLSGFNETKTYLIITKYKVSFKDGNLDKKIALNQKTYDANGKMVRIFTYDSISRQLDTYTYYYYSNGKPLSEETYDSTNSLISIVKYDSLPNTKQIFYYSVLNNLPKLDSTIEIHYENNRKKERLVLDSKGKWIEKQLHTKNDSKDIVLYTFHKKRKQHSCNCTELTYESYLDDKGKLIKEIRKFTDNKNNARKIETSIVYNPNGYIKSKSTVNESNEVLYTEKYRFIDFKPYSHFYYNADGKITKAFQFDVYQKNFENIGSIPSQLEILNKK